MVRSVGEQLTNAVDRLVGFSEVSCSDVAEKVVLFRP